MEPLARAGLCLLLAALLPVGLAACGCDGVNFAWDPIDLDLDDDDLLESDDDDSVQEPPVDDDDSAVEPEWDEGTCGYDLGATQCFDQDFAICEVDEDSGLPEWQWVETCEGETPLCDDELGCMACEPGTTTCEGSSVMECADDGSGWVELWECAAGDPCEDGDCQGACEEAAASHSYLGCDFLAVTTTNEVDNFDDDFAVVIGNPAGNSPTEVTVRRMGVVVATAVVMPGTSQAIELNMVLSLSQAWTSVLVPQGAYEVSTSVPVAAYQFSPLHFEMDGTYSYSNDASLLLPEHALTGDYMVSTHPSWGVGGWDPEGAGAWLYAYPGFVAVAATVDGTSVTVLAGGETAGSVPPAMSDGDQETVVLDRGDVLQVLSAMPTAAEQGWCEEQGWPWSLEPCDDYTCGLCRIMAADLTGTVVQADAPVAVFAGHRCTDVPFDSAACDHLEEMALPTGIWGTLMVMTAPVMPGGGGVAPALYRVLALQEGTTVAFEPAVHEPVVLAAGGFVEFQTAEDFVVEGSGPIQATQTLLGQDALGSETGDPALGTGIPWQQVRQEYDFLTPTTFDASYVNIVSPTGIPVELDGLPVGGFESIVGTAYEVARVPLSSGPHHVQSDQGGFGITTYGYARYTSYLYPGGLDLAP